MNNDWIIWNGGECPVPGKRVQVQFRYQSRIEAERYEGREADLLRWGHAGNGGDIIAYRIIPELLWAEVRGGFYGFNSRIVMSETHAPDDTICIRIPVKLIDGKRVIDDSRQPVMEKL